MIKKNYAIELPELDGFEYSGEYRKAKHGEFYLCNNFPLQALPATQNHYPILKKVVPKYKTTEIHTDNGFIQYVEIQAVKDAIKLSDVYAHDMTNAQCDEWQALEALIK